MQSKQSDDGRAARAAHMDRDTVARQPCLSEKFYA